MHSILFFANTSLSFSRNVHFAKCSRSFTRINLHEPSGSVHEDFAQFSVHSTIHCTRSVLWSPYTIWVSTHTHTHTHFSLCTHAWLMQELNKLRQVSLTFHMPELVEVLCIILGREMSSPHPTPLSKKMLQQCVTFLSSNKSPSERLIVSSSSKS